MRQLIIDAFVLLDGYRRLEPVLDFYPHGLKGLVADYLLHHLNSPSLWQEDNERDMVFVDQVIDKYRLSPAYRFHAYSKDDPDVEGTLFFVCLEMGEITRRMVQAYEQEFRWSEVDANTMTLGADYVMLERRN